MSLKILIHNVGHGHAIHAITPANELVVIDLGSSADYSPLGSLPLDRKTIDFLVLSHPHADHLSEIDKLKQFTVRQLSRPKWLTQQEIAAGNKPSDSGLIASYCTFSDRFIDPIPDNERVGNPSVSAGVTFKTFYSHKCGRSNLNNHSAISVFNYLGVNVIVPGDNEAASWNELLMNPEFEAFLPDTAFFLASHHGRESGFHLDLFNKKGLAPKLCAVSDGPVGPTGATADYSRMASGWNVLSRSTSTFKPRSCLTTRSDGNILLEIHKDKATGATFMSATTD
jgi:beta-lactamase superfamily II metal-dependent hydrolase